MVIRNNLHGRVFTPFSISVSLFVSLILLITAPANISWAQSPAGSYADATVTKLVASDAAAGDFFGNNLAADGDTILVGAPYDDGKGAVYVFVRVNGNWVEQAKLTASDGGAGDNFGSRCAIDGDIAVVGALYNDGLCNNCGAAYVFVREGNTWTQQAKLVPPDYVNDYAGMHFGGGVAIEGDTIVVGAGGADTAGTDAGAAYVFVRNGGNWELQARLLSSHGSHHDYFGSVLDLDGDTLIIGAGQDDPIGTESGSAYIFVRQGDTWTQQARLYASGGVPGEYFGSSVGISGDTAISGAPGYNDLGHWSGSAYVFIRSGNTWSQQARLLAPDGAPGDTFGYGGAIYGDVIAFGAGNDDDNGPDSGSVYVFVREGSSWVFQTKLLAPDGAAGDWLGRADVVVTDSYIVAGAAGHDANGQDSGAVYIFSVNVNEPPVASAGGPYLVEEGGSVSLAGAGSDPDGDPLTYAWDLDNNGEFETPGQMVTFSATGWDGPYSQPVTLQVCDNHATCDTDVAMVEILNVPPVVGSISVPVNLIRVGTEASVSANFTDPGVPDTHTATWDWGDGTTSNGTVTEAGGAGSVTGGHIYTVPGVYTITLTVTDDDGGSGSSAFQSIVVYNPEGGFVTGGGWFNSPPGAYKLDESLSGRVNFGFVSKYKRGASVPTGNTEFQFHAGRFNFHSDSYEWLVVNQAGRNAQFKGSGRVNGELAPNGSAYMFMVWVSDGNPDTFRIRIWWEDAGIEHVVYDNGTAQPIQGGNIVVHR